MGDRIDIIYKLRIGGRVALRPDGREWSQDFMMGQAIQCPPMGVLVDIHEIDEHGTLGQVAQGRMVDQEWAPEGGFVLCTLRVDGLTNLQRKTLGIAQGGEVCNAPLADMFVESWIDELALRFDEAHWPDFDDMDDETINREHVRLAAIRSYLMGALTAAKVELSHPPTTPGEGE